MISDPGIYKINPGTKIYNTKLCNTNFIYFLNNTKNIIFSKNKGIMAAFFLDEPPRECQLRRMFSEMAHPIELISKMTKAQRVDTCIKVCF